jgi:hypothetical protein
MEDLIQAFPDDFFPDKGFKFKQRQTSFAGVGRFDLLLEDRYGRNVLMELKAVPAKSDAVDQLIRYQEELRRRGEKNIVLWLVATLIPRTLADLLDRFGIEYKEIHPAEYLHAAERHGFSIRSEMQGPDGNRLEAGECRILGMRRSARLNGAPPPQVPTGPKVTVPPVLRWLARGFDLVLENPRIFESAAFLSLVDAFEQSVPSGKNTSLVRELKQWAKSPSSRWPEKSNNSLLRWVTTSSYKSAVPCAWDIWRHLFGEPAPTWYVWNQASRSYEFDHLAWKIWFESLNEAHATATTAGRP